MCDEGCGVRAERLGRRGRCGGLGRVDVELDHEERVRGDVAEAVEHDGRGLAEEERVEEQHGRARELEHDGRRAQADGAVPAVVQQQLRHVLRDRTHGCHGPAHVRHLEQAHRTHTHSASPVTHTQKLSFLGKETEKAKEQNGKRRTFFSLLFVPSLFFLSFFQQTDASLFCCRFPFFFIDLTNGKRSSSSSRSRTEELHRRRPAVPPREGRGVVCTLHGVRRQLCCERLLSPCAGNRHRCLRSCLVCFWEHPTRALCRCFSFLCLLSCFTARQSRPRRTGAAATWPSRRCRTRSRTSPMRHGCCARSVCLSISTMRTFVLRVLFPPFPKPLSFLTHCLHRFWSSWTSSGLRTTTRLTTCTSCRT